jgi:hypothetical protein
VTEGDTDGRAGATEPAGGAAGTDLDALGEADKPGTGEALPADGAAVALPDGCGTVNGAFSGQ